MDKLATLASELDVPDDYFNGRGSTDLPTLSGILMFTRQCKQDLQQEALQNRSHHRFVLCINLQTSGTVHINHLNVILSPGHALLIFPYQFHHFSQLDSFELTWMFCTFDSSDIHYFEPLRNRPVQFQGRLNDEVERLIQMWKHPSSKTHPEPLQALLLQLVAGLKREAEKSSAADQAPPESSLLRSVNRLLIEIPQGPVTIDDLAEKMNVSGSRLRALFRESAGITLGQYIKNFRLHRAMQLLSDTDFSIADVAGESGFGSPQAFCRTFKMETGMTPRDYRYR